MSSSREDIINETLEKAVGEIIEQLPSMKQAFLNPTYDLNRTVENESDFLLGAFCACILERCGAYLWRRQIYQHWRNLLLSVIKSSPVRQNLKIVLENPLDCE